MVIFLYNLDIFVWIQHGCLAKTVFALDPSNRIIESLWCKQIHYHNTRKGSLTEDPDKCDCVECTDWSESSLDTHHKVHFHVKVKRYT